MSPIIDFNVMLGASIQGYRLEPGALLAEMDRLGIDRAVLCPVRPLEYEYGSANDYVASVRDSHPDRFYAFGRVDARLTSAADEAERCLATLQFDGLFLHPWEDVISAADRRYDPVVAVCARHGVPILIAGGYPFVAEALQIADLARRFPSVPIIMTNGGQINISGLGQRNAWIAVETMDNVYITTSGLYREDFLEEVATKIGPHKVLFGSQAPIYDQDFELHRVLWAHIQDETKKQILGKSALDLLGRVES